MSTASASWQEARIVLFDVEGTLVDTVMPILKCWQATLREEGFAIDITRLHALSGLDGDAMLQELCPALDAAQRKAVLEKQGKRYRRDYLPHVAAFAGVRDLFAQLRAEARTVALATDCQRDELEHYVKLAGIAGLVDAVACGDDVDHGKPWPDLPALALRRAGGSTAVMVGDTPFDARAAAKAGIAAIGVETGGFDARALLQAGCAAVFPNVGALRLG